MIDSLGMDSRAVVQRNREIPQSSASVIRYIQVVLVLVSSAFSQWRSALSALPSASALGFVGSAFSQCARLCRLFLQPVHSALSALPSASALGFVGSSFSQCTRLCYNIVPIRVFYFVYVCIFREDDDSLNHGEPSSPGYEHVLYICTV